MSEVASHLVSGGEMEVDEDALRDMLDRLVSEGQLEGRGEGFSLTGTGEVALTDLEDDTTRTTSEPGAVELSTPETTAPDPETDPS